jgi:hypothetical protein
MEPSGMVAMSIPASKSGLLGSFIDAPPRTHQKAAHQKKRGTNAGGSPAFVLLGARYFDEPL